MKKKINVCIYGNIIDPNEWSGTGFYFFKNLSKIYKSSHGLNLKTNNLGYKVRRIIWNIYTLFFFKSVGGFQYSFCALNSIWPKINFDNQIIINFFQLFPPQILNKRRVSRYFYIDFTITQLFNDYGKPMHLNENILRKIILYETEGYRKSKHIFTHSNYAKNSLISDYNINPNHVSVVVPGANLEGDLRSNSLPINSSERIKIIFIGKDLYRKGLDRMLKAIKIINQKKIICELLVVGQYICNDKRLNQFSKDRDPYVIEKGFIDKSKDELKLNQLILNSDLGILLSRNEAGGMVLREYGIRGLPTIVTDVGGIKEHVNIDSSIIIEGDTENEIINCLVANIKELYFNRKYLNTLKVKAKKNIKKYRWQYSVENLINKINEIE